MGFGTILAWTSGVFAVVGSLYGLHRLALWLEERGHLYYLKKKSSGSAAGSFVALQRFIEPKAEHVLVLKDAGMIKKEGEAEGGPTPVKLGGSE